MRFKGFEREWNDVQLGSITEKINSGKTPLGGEAVYLSNGVIFIRSQNVVNDKLDLTNSVFISEHVNAGMKNSVVKANDILLNITGASLGRSCVVPDEFVVGNVNQHVCIIRLTKQFNPRFIQPILASAKGQNIFLSLQTGSGREGLNFENIKGIKISVPCKDEQDKIASFLAHIDDRIQTQNKIIEDLKSLITGTISTVEKQAKNNSQWKKFFLNEVLTERTEKNEKNHPVHSVSVSVGVVNQIEYLGRSFASKNTLHYNVVHDGDIVYTKSPTGEFPYGIIKQSFIKNNVAVSPLYGVYKPINYWIGNILHYYFLNPVNANNYLHSLIQKGAKNTINISNQGFLNKQIYLPANETEGKKTAMLLNSITQKLAVERAILERYNSQKREILKRLFV